MTPAEYIEFVLQYTRQEHPGKSEAAIYEILRRELGPTNGAVMALAERLGADMGAPVIDGFRNRDSGDFLRSFEWRRLRMEVLMERGAKCELCGRTPRDGIAINVDHIKNRKAYPHLALTKSNLQVLCNECNHGKGNRWDTDFRATASDHSI